MKIAVREITSSGLDIDRRVPAEAWALDGFGVHFIHYINLSGKLKKKYGQLKSNIGVTARCEVNCSRCLEEVCQVRKYKFKRDYQLADLGDFLDLGQDVREEILLNFSLGPLCFSGCRGLCPRCGKNLNWEKCIC